MLEATAMATLSISEAREHLSDLGNQVALRGERIVIERRGKDIFAMVPIEDLEILERIEDQIDLETIRKRSKEGTLPLSKLRKAVGL
jgi:prevent-host-death family protein